MRGAASSTPTACRSATTSRSTPRLCHGRGATFYASPPPRPSPAGWTQCRPAFTFCCKFPRTITHDKRLVDCEAETLEFLAFEPTGNAYAAPAFLQFRPRSPANNPTANWPPILTARAPGDGSAHCRGNARPGSDDARVRRLLAERGIALVLVDRVATPGMTEAWLEATTDETFARCCPFVVVRWIGDDENRQSVTTSTPRNADLDRWTLRLADFARRH
ncbi:MAG: DUF72 domain-containing protein [Caldilineaceae bacterium]